MVSFSWTGWADEGGAPYRMSLVIAKSAGNAQPLRPPSVAFTGHRSLRPKDKKRKGKATSGEENVAIKGWVSVEGLWLQDELGNFEMWGDLQPATSRAKIKTFFVICTHLFST